MMKLEIPHPYVHHINKQNFEADAIEKIGLLRGDASGLNPMYPRIIPVIVWPADAWYYVRNPVSIEAQHIDAGIQRAIRRSISESTGRASNSVLVYDLSSAQYISRVTFETYSHSGSTDYLT